MHFLRHILFQKERVVIYRKTWNKTKQTMKQESMNIDTTGQTSHVHGVPSRMRLN